MSLKTRRQRLFSALLACGTILTTAVFAAHLLSAGNGNGNGNGNDNDNDQGENERGGTYAIGLWGDLPYSDTQAAAVKLLIADMNQQDLTFTVHDGDLKAGNGTAGSLTPTICSDAMYMQALGYLNS